MMKMRLNRMSLSVALATAAFAAGTVLAGPKGAAGDAYIMMWVDDNFFQAVQQYDGVTGAWEGPFATDMINNMRDLTFGPNGNLYVLNNGSGTVEEYDGSTGDLLGTRVTGIVVGESMLFLPDGTLLVSHLTPSTIEQYDTEANGYAPLGIWASGLEPLQNSMIIGADGRVYVGDRLDNTVKVFDVDGSNMSIFADGSGGELNVPEGISFGFANGNLFVASFSANTVTEWDGVSGAFIGTFATDRLNPDGLRFAPNGKMWVIYASSPQARVYDEDGTVVIDIFDAMFAPRSITFKPGGAGDCLTMSVSKLVAGEGAKWGVSGATAGAEVAIVWGTAAGNTSIKDFAGYCASFGIKGVKTSRVICRKTADGNGDVSCTIAKIPAGAKGLTIFSQAAERNTCPDTCMSNLDEQVVG